MTVMNTPHVVTLDAANKWYTVRIHFVLSSTDVVTNVITPWYPFNMFGVDTVFDPVAIQGNLNLPAFQCVDFSFDFNVNSYVATPAKQYLGPLIVWTEDSLKTWTFNASHGGQGITVPPLGNTIVGRLYLDCLVSGKVHMTKLRDANDGNVSGEGSFTFNTFNSGDAFIGVM